jgi:hypothetical protein
MLRQQQAARTQFPASFSVLIPVPCGQFSGLSVVRDLGIPLLEQGLSASELLLFIAESPLQSRIPSRFVVLPANSKFAVGPDDVLASIRKLIVLS